MYPISCKPSNGVNTNHLSFVDETFSSNISLDFIELLVLIVIFFSSKQKGVDLIFCFSKRAALAKPKTVFAGWSAGVWLLGEIKHLLWASETT